MNVPRISTAIDEVPAGYLTKNQVLRHLGITYRQLDYWTRVYLRQPPVGYGIRRLWSGDELKKLQRLKKAAAFKSMPLDELADELEKCGVG